jgi:NAD(P)-dependent dehydrogenase (short-subunit alcohol dehydrogenase family)
MKKSKFSEQDISDLSGKIILITGGNSGIGLQTATVLAQHQAEVIISTRDQIKGEKTVAEIKAKFPLAKISYVITDLADLASVNALTTQLNTILPRLDILINNAGIMSLPKRELTKDGFEKQLGTNYLGHFALTLGLLPLLRKSSAPRVISLSSIVAYQGKINFKDLQAEKKYSPMGAYCQSKLAAILFAKELARQETYLTSVAVHPGIVWTNLQRHMKIGKLFFKLAVLIAGQSVEKGALPSLYAASQPNLVSGQFYGPNGKFGKGSAGIRRTPKRALNIDDAKKLWDISLQLIKTKS